MPAEQSTTTGNPAGGTIPPPPAIRLKHISKSFGAVRANRDVSLEVAKGSIHGIVGENGAGKSTTFRLIAGELEPDTGEIVHQGDLVVSQLAQTLPEAMDQHVRDIVRSGLVEIEKLLEEYKRRSELDLDRHELAGVIAPD